MVGLPSCPCREEEKVFIKIPGARVGRLSIDVGFSGASSHRAWLNTHPSGCPFPVPPCSHQPRQEPRAALMAMGPGLACLQRG